MLTNKHVFITGGSGTIGHAILTEAVDCGSNASFTIYSRDPVKHHNMARCFPGLDLRFVLGDILDASRLEAAMAGHDLVIHAAAMKHIPEGEAFPWSMYATNVTGLQNTILAAMATSVEHFLFISTDKAVEPHNVYGCTKRMGEALMREAARDYPGVKFHTARYGNVLQSSGSVLELWRKQAAAGQALSVTHPSMTRFWITPWDAVSILLTSLHATGSGEIYVPKMRASSLSSMIDAMFAGSTAPAIEEIPIRPGEKIHESLLSWLEYPYARILKDAFIIGALSSDVIGAAYTSDRADLQMTREEICTMLEKIGFRE